MNKFFAYALAVTGFSVVTSWASWVTGPSTSSGYHGSSWSSSSGSWGGGGGGHK
ncbi:hypothetical protein [Pseudoduganella sp. OTU4001]|uniref:hypothetical protein n=1 Tax=Pseudoduganella sp. OTU4001 TaxID=3043854 RepID=UPI00313E97D0